jgi:hypothetical protein
MPGLRLVGAVDAIAVILAGSDVGDIAVPDLVGIFRQLDAQQLALAVAVEEADLDLRRIGGEEREIDPLAVPARAEGKGHAFTDAWLADVGHRDTHRF